MKDFMKKYKRYIIILAILIGIWVYNNINKVESQSLTDSDIVDVEMWSIWSSLQVLWTVKIVNNQKLTFGNNGRVTELYVNQWDMVTKWQLLAEIDTSDALNNIEQQRLQVSSAMINYNKLFSNTKDYQIKQAQADAERLMLSSSMWDIELQQLDLEKQEAINTQKNNIQTLKDRISLNKSKIDTLKWDIEYTILSEWQTLNTAEADNNAALQMVQNSVKSSILDIKDLLAVVKGYLYFDTSEKYPLELWAKDSSARQRAELTYVQLKKILSDFESASFQIPSNYNSAKILLDKNKQLIDAWMKLCDDTYGVFDASVVWVNLTESDLGMQKNTIISTRSNLNNSLNNLVNLDKQLATALDPEITKLNTQNNISQKEQNLQDLQNAIDNDTRWLVEAEDKLAKLYLDYDIKIQDKKNDVTIQAKNAEVARLNAISIANWPTSDDIAWASNVISQAKVWLLQARNALEDYQIIALFDGEVSAIDFDVDDQISAYNQWLTIEASGSYEVNILLDQLDIVKIHPWQEAKISLDAYPDTMFDWYVTTIDPTPIKDQWVVSYKATILLNQTDVPIYNEMSATVTIEIDKRDDVLLVPSLSVMSSWYDNYVELYNNGTISMQLVTVGINNGKKIEIISGLSLGQQIILRNFKVDKVEWSVFQQKTSHDDNPWSQMKKMDSAGAR